MAEKTLKPAHTVITCSCKGTLLGSLARGSGKLLAEESLEGKVLRIGHLYKDRKIIGIDITIFVDKTLIHLEVE